MADRDRPEPEASPPARRLSRRGLFSLGAKQNTVPQAPSPGTEAVRCGYCGEPHALADCPAHQLG